MCSYVAGELYSKKKKKSRAEKEVKTRYEDIWW